ncbi:hypothetical protein [Agrobacterium tumefaciens]|uniref:hypothetical protein n=1 Tax=Agrobacterium tumefaciens TaxID=358 RepID=UPI0021CE042A|nr:hypothetical protein [Agrobacterium tumefaciens]UXT96736.1 hypothetical protein FY129_04360 [Agrobacterium tumefaciens]
MRHTDKRGGTKLPSAVMLERCVRKGMGRNQIAEHYEASINRVTARCKELDLVAPLNGKSWQQVRFDFTTVVIRRFGSSITLPCPAIYAAALKMRSGAPSALDL